MKTLIRFSQFLALPLMIAAAFSGCGKSDSSTATTTSAYSYVNGLCYATSTNTQVPTTDCATSTTSYNSSMFSWNGSTCTSLRTGSTVNSIYCTSNPFTTTSGGCFDSTSQSYVETAYCSMSTSSTNGYYYSNGLCYSTVYGTQVPVAYCSNASTTTSGTTLSQVCNGTYIYTGGGAARVVTCSGANCRGYIMYTYSTQQPVMCL